MENIDLQTHGFRLNEAMRKHILKRVHTVFGFGEYKVKKIIITLFDKSEKQDKSEISCHVHVKVQDQPSIIAEYNTMDIFSAFDLAIERASIKASNRLKDEKHFRKQLEYKRSPDLFGAGI